MLGGGEPQRARGGGLEPAVAFIDAGDRHPLRVVCGVLLTRRHGNPYGMMKGMAKRKTTITVESHKVDEARRLTGAASTSATIDVALDRLIRTERLRRDVAAYAATPPTDEEVALAAVEPSWDALADDTDWAALYADES